MRAPVDEAKLRAFMEALGGRATGPGRVYVVGGATALLLGFRRQTIDVDLKLDPEPAGAFEAIAGLKQELDVNVELAAPDDFVPALPGWRERSEEIGRWGKVEFFHYDFYGQALAKIARGHRQDLQDAANLVRTGRVDPDELIRLFDQTKAEMIRYPSQNLADLEARLTRFLESLDA